MTLRVRRLRTALGAVAVAFVSACAGAPPVEPGRTRPEPPPQTREETAPEAPEEAAPQAPPDPADAEALALARRLADDFTDVDAHARLFALTGMAERVDAVSPAEALRMVSRHPYDPYAQFAGGRALLAARRPRQAARVFEAALFAADLDPGAARAAFVQLGALDPDWRERTLVPVTVLADAEVRSEDAWRMRLRTLWWGVNRSLGPLIGVVFLPVALTGFEAGEGPRLSTVLRALRAHRPVPPHGILVGFTGIGVPRVGGRWRHGVAEFLGRRAVVRLSPDTTHSRVLMHELLHLYGAVHVTRHLDSLMNPDGAGEQLDQLNHAIVQSLRARRFSNAGLEADVLSQIDVEATAQTYRRALEVQLAFREMGLSRAVEERSLSQRRAERLARDARSLDAHLGDVAAFAAQLELRSGRPAAAMVLFDSAAALYGSRSVRGRAARAAADAIHDRWAASPSENGQEAGPPAP